MQHIRSCDLAIVGGGLAGGLIALAVAQARPEAVVLIVEGGDRLGGNHLWSFFDSDIAPEDRSIVLPLAAHDWAGYDVAFPGHRRTLTAGYHTVTSERLDAAVRAALPAARILTGRRAIELSPTSLVLDDGSRIEATGVIDTRGAGDVSLLDSGWQKFLGQELVLAAPHGLTRPVVMDAMVDQTEGYRFVYCLPFARDRIFVEDTYYGDTPDIDRDRLAARIAAYARDHGWTISRVEREEAGALPVTMGGDFEAYWRSGGVGIAKAGVRAALFHPTTGYSLPDAARTARAVATMADWSAPGLHDRLHDRARTHWRRGTFYRLLDRMLFRAAEPAQRYRILERFYRLDPALIGRFYAGQSTRWDKARILAGRPPVPIGRAARALMGV